MVRHYWANSDRPADVPATGKGHYIHTQTHTHKKSNGPSLAQTVLFSRIHSFIVGCSCDKKGKKKKMEKILGSLIVQGLRQRHVFSPLSITKA